MGAINTKGNTKVSVKTSNGDFLSPGLHFDHEARVDKCILKNVGKTKEELIVPIVQELFLCTTYGEVITRAEHVAKKLEDLDCFDKVTIHIDSNKEKQKRVDNGLQVTLDVKELDWVTINCGATSISDQSAFEMSMKMPNVRGGAEKIECKGCYSIPDKNSLWNIVGSKPLHHERNSVGLIEGFRTSTSERDLKDKLDHSLPNSGYAIERNGIRLGFSFDMSANTRNTVYYENSKRHQLAEGADCPEIVKKECGTVEKHSLIHKLVWNDCKPHAPGLPAVGTRVNLNSEFAGLGGDVGFVKTEIKAETSRLLLRNWTGHLTGQAGYVTNTKKSHLFLSDKFYLGGPTCVRGFKRHGIGPQDQNLPLGSDIYGAAGVHLYRQIGNKEFKERFGDNLRFHAFTNFGTCAETKDSKDVSNLLSSMAQSLRVAIGLGLSLRLGEQAQLELNYCMPIRSMSGDHEAKGFQFGIGLNFL